MNRQINHRVILFRDPGDTIEVDARVKSISTSSDPRDLDRSGPNLEFSSSPESPALCAAVSHPPPPPLPRESDTADPYERLLSAAGISFASIPVLAYEFVNLQFLAEELTRPEKFQGLILTSPRAVQAVENAIEMIASSSSSSFVPVPISSSSKISSVIQFLRLPIFVVGAATQKVAESKFKATLEKIKTRFAANSSSSISSSSTLVSADFNVVLNFMGAETGNAKCLAEFIIEHFPANSRGDEGVRLLSPGSSIRSPALQERLEEAGMVVVGLSVYQTTTHPEITQNLEKWALSSREMVSANLTNAPSPPHPPPPTSSLPHPDACVFFSPSGVKSVSPTFDYLQWPVNAILLVAVGPTTMKALHAKGYEKVEVSSKPNPQQVVETVVEALRKNGLD